MEVASTGRLVPPRQQRTMPLWARAAAVGLAITAVFVYVAVSRSAQPKETATSSYQAAKKPWPSVEGLCGPSQLALVGPTDILSATTGIQLFVGGQPRAMAVDVDTGAVTQGEPAASSPDQFVGELADTKDGTLALVSTCTESVGLAKLRADGGLGATLAPEVNGLLVGGDHPWGLIYPSSDSVSSGSAGPASLAIQLDPLNGGSRIELPAGAYPIGAFGDLVVTRSTSMNGSSDDFAVFDTATSTPAAPFGSAPTASTQVPSLLLMSGSTVIWTGRDCSSSGCQLHRYDLTTGINELGGTVRVPSGRILLGTSLSPDGTTVVGTLRRAKADLTYESANDPTNTPLDFAVVDVQTGELEVVPGIELGPLSGVIATFSRDSRWLIMPTVAVDLTLRILLWRQGLDRPLESSAKAMATTGYTPILQLP